MLKSRLVQTDGPADRQQGMPQSKAAPNAGWQYDCCAFFALEGKARDVLWKHM